MTNTGSGISGQFGLAAESTVGTAVTVTRFLEINSEDLTYTPKAIQGQGIHAGGQYNRASRYVRTTKTVNGTVKFDFAANGLGLVLKHMLGSSASATLVNGGTDAYEQIHNPGPLTGLSLTMQKGVPQASDATVQAYTYNGCKISDWTLSCAVDEILTLELSVDAWNMTDATALAAASYTTTEVFHFAECAVKFGGTASINTGVTSISGGTSVSNLTGFELKGSNPMKTDRFFLGASGVKAEQVENDYRPITGSFDGEFEKADLYDVFKDGTTTAVQITFTGSNIESGSDYKLDIVLPACKFTSGTNNLDGPDVVATKLEFEAKDDESTTPIQITLVSTDTAL